MTDVRLGILVLGVVFVLAVWMFNKMQERRERARAARASSPRDVLFDRVDEDALHAGEKHEPTFEGAALYGRNAQLEPNEPEREHAIGRASAEPEIDEEIHAVIALALEQPLAGERILAASHALRHAGRQTVTLWGASERGWCRVAAGERFTALIVAVQLANRSGPINEIEYSEFVARLQQAAEQIAASCDVPDMMETVARARALDARCAPLDAQIGVTVAHLESQWPAEVIDQRARELGLVLRPDGHYHALLADGHTLFTLQNAEGTGFRDDQLGSLRTGRLTLVLDLPCTPRGMEPFTRMAAAAQSLAERLGGILVDDQLRTLTAPMLAGITRQIEPVYERLEAAGVPAGSPRALALFS
jgi:FtsZ-interacting cell division protein ZipA